MNRRTFLAASAGLAPGIGTDALAVEPADVELSEHEVNAQTEAGQRRALFAQVSHLHIHRVAAMHRRIAAEVNARRPHFILLTRGELPREKDHGRNDEGPLSLGRRPFACRRKQSRRGGDGVGRCRCRRAEARGCRDNQARLRGLLRGGGRDARSLGRWWGGVSLPASA